MIAKLIVGGKEFPIEIQDPELQKLLAPPNKTGYERVCESETYYYQGFNGEIDSDSDDHYGVEDECYDSANYYSDKSVAENNVRADKLMRQLRRFAVEHRENELDWNKETCKYCIRYARGNLELWNEICGREFGQIYFDTGEAAELAMDTFHDELIWYFTEYKDSL